MRSVPASTSKVAVVQSNDVVIIIGGHQGNEAEIGMVAAATHDASTDSSGLVKFLQNGMNPYTDVQTKRNPSFCDVNWTITSSRSICQPTTL